MAKNIILKNEDGATLVESLVAMAILVSVLLPAVMFLGYIANTNHNKDKIIALGLAQSEMETVLKNKSFSNSEREVGGRFIIQNKIVKEDKLVQINISVYRRNKPDPILKLTTERLLYE